MRRHILAAMALTALGSTAAHAVDNGIYIGASVGDAGVEFDDVEGFNIDDSDTGFKLNAGWRILDWLAVEANYIDLGSTEGTFTQGSFVDEPLEFETTGINFSGLLFLPVGPVDFFARAGFVTWDAEAKLSDITDATDDDSGMDFSYGGGAQFRVWSLSLRAEYEVFDISEADNVDMISLGIMWTFL